MITNWRSSWLLNKFDGNWGYFVKQVIWFVIRFLKVIFQTFSAYRKKNIIFSYFLPHYIVYLNEGGYFKSKQRGRIQNFTWPPCSAFQFVEWSTDLIHLTFHHRIIYWLIGKRSKCVVNTGLLHLPSGHFKSTVCFKAAKLVDELYSIYFSLGQE